jgi:UDP-N-acetylmuramate: L-alanyl-gamma-D-glutamyl-meso-diaminopimelate ligase
LSVESIEAAFQHPNLKVFTQPEALHQQLQSMDYQDTVLLMMSSGNYGTMDWEALIRQLTLF